MNKEIIFFLTLYIFNILHYIQIKNTISNDLQFAKFQLHKNPKNTILFPLQSQQHKESLQFRLITPPNVYLAQ